MRLSSYTIPVKINDNQDKYIIVHGYTGAIDVINKDLYNYISKSTNLLDENSPYTKDIIEKLQRRGYLTHRTAQEEIEYVRNAAQVLHKKHYRSRKSFVLVVTYDCNFQCPYCFEEEFFNTINHRKTISRRMVDNFYNSIQFLEPDQKLRNRQISLFGGEPLLKENKQIIDYIVRKGNEYGFSFTATSNGYDIDHYEELLGANLIEGIQVTIDGTRNVHDSRRIHSVKKISYDQIIKNIFLALNKDIAIRVRMNVDENNYNEVHKLNNEFTELGLFKYKNFSVYSAFISGSINFSPEAYTDNKKPLTQKKFIELFKDSNLKIQNNVSLHERINSAITQNKPITLIPYHCNSHTNSYVFDPYGNIYSCLEVIGDKHKAIGTYNGTIKWKKEKEVWHTRNITSVNKCLKCRYAFLCGGGCFAKVISSGKQIDSYCDGFPIVFQNTMDDIFAQKNKSY